MIRLCHDGDLQDICSIVNDAALAYRGIIPPDRWHEPYMPLAEVQQEVAAGVVFWGLEEDGRLIGVMGIQDRGPVTLIRHAYIRSEARGKGIGSLLLRHLEQLTDKPILVGTWADAVWAISFYQKNGYRLLPTEEKNRLLRRFWSIPERQVETSVVLAGPHWQATVDSPACRP